MNAIQSDKLTEGMPSLQPTDALQVSDARVLNVDTQTIIELTEEHSRQIEDIALRSLNSFSPTQDTLALATTGLVTAIARVDCTIHPSSGDIFAYEADERPAGMGITDAIGTMSGTIGVGDDIRSHLEEVFGQIPIVKRHPNEPINDDGMILPRRIELMGPRSVRPKNRPILVRGKPRDMAILEDVDDAATLSVSTIVDEGRRVYRLINGDATLATDTSVLPESSFVAKTLQGSQSDGVEICVNREDRDSLGRGTTRAQIQTMLKNREVLMIEPFVPGVEVKLGSQVHGRMIMRVFCLISSGRSAHVINGTFTARPGHRVHGAEDAIAGLVVAN